MMYYILIILQSIKIDKLNNEADHIRMHKMELFMLSFGRIFYDASLRALELVNPAL